MKDLEKIKSEDLGCQVADANPGNFGIEQEVAAMVGATVPAPTEPSADDARELGAQLLVFLRRALLPIRSALRTALAAIYAHLDSRCTDYTPAAYAPYQPLPSYDPMGTPPTPRTLPNLLTAITAFSPRKIRVDEGIPDGMPFLQLVTSRNTSITKLCDSVAFDLCYRDQLYAIFSALPNLNEMEIHCKRLTGYAYSRQVWFPSNITKINGSSEVFEIPELERFEGSSYCGFPTEAQNFRVWSFPNMVYSRSSFSNATGKDTTYYNTWTEEILVPKIRQFGGYASESNMGNFTALRRVVMGTLTADITNGYHQAFYNDPNLIDIEICADGGMLAINLWLNQWEPTNALSSSASDLVADPTAHPTWNNLDQFLQNFKEHIALRLTDQGSGKTLTLSQAVRDAIHAAEATYGIEAIIVTQKGWTLSPAPTA